MLNLLTLIGSLGLFLFAFRLISESLQKISGDHLRHAQSGMTGNLFKSMFTGLGITSYLQSSQATTVMAVSFANAGIITLSQSMAVIMGANVGTTVTAWIIAWLGIKSEILLWAFPIIAFTLPFFSSKRSTANSWGDLLLGVALSLISLGTLEYAISSFAASGVPTFFINDGEYNIGWILLFILLGTVATTLVRTSVASFALVLLFSINDMLSLPLACSILVGANIGTCIPAVILSRKGNAMARRAAIGHILFNIFGTIWALVFLANTQECYRGILQLLNVADTSIIENAPWFLASFHTLFNLLTMVLLIPLIKQFVKLVTAIIPDRKNEDSHSFSLKYISGDIVPTSGEMALVQVQKEVSLYASDTYNMFAQLSRMMREPMGSERQLELKQVIQEMEEDSDNAALEIAQFLNRIEPQTLSMSGEQLCRSYYKVVDELESIADCILHCSKALYQKSEQRIRFTKQMNDDLSHMMALTDEVLKHAAHVLSLDEVPSNALNKAYNIEDEINNLRNQLRNQMLIAIERREIEYQQHSFFTLLINECEKIGDYVINVIAAASI